MGDARKQSLSHDGFLDLWNRARELVPDAALDRKIEQSVALIERHCRGKRAGFAWSGGKDSIPLQYVCDAAGVHDCVLGITRLEYPAFLRWVTDNMPERLVVVNTGQDLAWLAEHPNMLFPQESRDAAAWFRGVQHRAQRMFYRDRKLDVIALGRRLSDGNYVNRDGGKGEPIYTSKGITRLSPIAHWTHADCFALIQREGLPIPPIYGWPRGFRVGTHPWAARQWCRDEAHGWSEVFQIDPEIVDQAAGVLPGARQFLEAI